GNEWVREAKGMLGRWQPRFFETGLNILLVNAGGVIERLGERGALLLASEQFLGALLGLAPLAITLLEQGNALFVARQRFFQADFAVFQFVDNALEVGERLFERRTWRGCVAHALNRPTRLADPT